MSDLPARLREQIDLWSGANDYELISVLVEAADKLEEYEKANNQLPSWSERRFG